MIPYLNGVDIMSDHDKLCLLLFHQFGDSVGARTDGVGPLGQGLILLGNLWDG